MELTTPRVTAFIPHTPTEPQAAFLLLDCLEAFYGGAAGGGKSDALLMGALQYVDVPGYAALILRRTFAQLTKADALITRAHQWLQGTDAKWHEQRRTWTFPSGATLSFGHVEHETSMYDYQGAAFHFVGFDELTQFTETQYRYIAFSRGRRLMGSTVPIRIRSTSNPGGEGHDWVKARFIDGAGSNGRPFIPARLEDNPHQDREVYAASLEHLDPVTRQRLLLGDWEAREPGGYFNRAWFGVADPEAEARLKSEQSGVRRVRFWDMAATEPTSANPDPDWTVGLRLAAEPNGLFWVEDMVRVRKRPSETEELIRVTADTDGSTVAVRMEQEPAAAGKTVIEHYRQKVLQGYDFRGIRSTGDKETRAGPVSARAEAREIKLVRGTWNLAFLDEVESFPEGSHKDVVDALSGAYNSLFQGGELASRSFMPSGGKQRVVRHGDLVWRGRDALRHIDKK